MPKRPLYARATASPKPAALTLLLLTWTAVAAANPPCGPCIRVSITPAQAMAVTSPLDGAAIFVRVPAAGAAEAVPAVRTLVSRGASAGLHVIGVPLEPEIAMAMPFRQLVIDLPAPPGLEQLAALKEALVAARGLHRDAAIYVALPDGAAGAAEALRPYVDAVLPPTVPFSDLWTALHADDGRLRILTAGSDAMLDGIARAQSLLPKALAPIRDRAIRCDGRPLDTYLDPATLALVAIGSCAPGSDVRSDTGAPAAVVSLGSFDVVRVADASGDRFREGVAISGTRRLSVEEIVARHQAFVAAQSAAISSRISTAAFTLTFEAPGFPAPVTINAETVFFTSGDDTELQERNLRVNGVAFDAKGGIPRLPILEPERVAAPPLTITLTDLYRYRLEGETTVRGRRCYVVAFRPASRTPLAAGTAWIDEQTFAMARVHAVQTGLRGPITASEQLEEFAPDGSGRWMPLRTEVNQTYEGASFRTPIHRVLDFRSHVLDPPDFSARLQAAYASNDVMLRDTPEGYRYLRRARAEQSGTVERGAVSRVEAGRVDRVRTLAMGVLVDPNISRPLPFAGLSYADFNLFNRGAQLNGFFGGTYGQAAFAWPSIARTGWQMSGRASAIAVSYNDRAFIGGREQYDLDIRQRPASAAIGVLHPIAARAAVRAQYEFDYVGYSRGDQTSPSFRVPADQQVHGLRLGIDVQRGDWQGSLWWSGSGRIGWRPWGIAGDAESDRSPSKFQRFGAGLLRSGAISPRLTTRLELAVMAGADLDRFSRFTFGTFDNRLHGYPSALIRYDRGGVVRTAIAWSAGAGVRLDGFADTAQVHDPGFGSGLRNYTGFGAAAEVPAPWRTLAAVEWGYGVQARNASGGRGTQVVRITAYKVF
jgi:hypothetical protein